MKIVDLHCDTLHRLYLDNTGASLRKNSFHVDMEKLTKTDSLAQCFAIFIELEKIKTYGYTPFEACMKMIQLFEREMEANHRLIRPIKRYGDIIQNQQDGIISAILTVEEGGVLEGKPQNLGILYEKGVRMITLTWNYPNEIGYPNYEYSQSGLTDFGCETVGEMNRLGIIIDVSHLSDAGFYDVAKLSKMPFVASHSNARGVKNHPRNLTDEMIKLLAEKGGVMGINYCAAFLGESSMSQVEDIVRHIKHIKNVGGIDVIALGSDFDGIDCSLEIADIGQTHKLIEALEKNQFTPMEIAKICYQNSLRLFSDTIK